MGNILGWGEKQGKKKESAFREEVLGGVTRALDPKGAVQGGQEAAETEEEHKADRTETWENVLSRTF